MTRFLYAKPIKEYRLIFNSNSDTHGIMSLPNYAPFLRITGIILGNKIEAENRKHIETLWKTHEQKIELFQAKLSEETYEIFHVPHVIKNHTVKIKREGIK